jgi:hypothetical protein
LPLTLESSAELELSVVCPLESGSRLLDACGICALPGGATGEIALSRRVNSSASATRSFTSADGFRRAADKYCTDAKLLRHSLRNLLRYQFSTLTFAHGLPLVAQARSRLEALIRMILRLSFSYLLLPALSCPGKARAY